MIQRPGLLGVFGVLAALCLFMLAVFSYGEFTTSIAPAEPLAIEVRNGDSLTALINRLSAERRLARPRMFRLLAIVRGDTGRIKAGEYVLDKPISPNHLLDLLVSGSTHYITLTIPEGFTLREVAARLGELHLADTQRFLHLSVDPAFIAGLQLPLKPDAANLEGFVFPETYYLQRGLREEHLLRMMVDVFRRRTGDLLGRVRPPHGLAPYEALILASIVEKETGAAEERALIAGVFHNRLQARMRLGSDPTVIYGLRDFDGNLTRIHLRTQTPYNTYTNPGLPPTPIANPGLESIRAVLQPARVDYLYFVSKGDGTHFFSKDLKAHNRAVLKFQKRPHRGTARNGRQAS
ncbi:MAG: endolytic transglycosylase MltG [Candidatus Lambdaproteobacteria bacterium]|nr:endolytic transglycosylase MltG [Candidatus Lambdaproteobacteria bacterium]